jgi:hypothetical protein
MSHCVLAAGGLVLWIMYLAVDEDALAWIAFVALAVVALLGCTMFAIWQAGPRWSRRRGDAEDAAGAAFSRYRSSAARRPRRDAARVRPAHGDRRGRQMTMKLRSKPREAEFSRNSIRRSSAFTRDDVSATAEPRFGRGSVGVYRTTRREWL